MGKRRVKNTYEHYCNKLQDGRGCGQGVDYIPWHSGHEFASNGAYVRIKGFTVPREYVFFSHLESDVFRIYDHTPGVTDIKEQYPLPLSDTLTIADRLGIRHPYKDSFYNVVTTDLLIRKDGNWIGRAIKSSADLKKKRIVEKLNIECEWFRQNRIQWRIVTEKEINRELVANLKWLYEDGEDYTSLVSDPEARQLYERELLNLYKEEAFSFSEILEIIEEAFSIGNGTSMAVFKHLVRTKQICIDMEKQFNLKNPRQPLERRGERYGRYSSYAPANHPGS